MGSGSVGAFFTAAASKIESLRAEVGSERPRVSFGRMEAGKLFFRAQERYAVELVAGFEGNPRVAGGALRGSEVARSERNDALVLLEFRAGAVDLPLHVHEHSARCIVVAEGCGFFHYVAHAGGKVRARTVSAGDTITFLRGVIHTFAAPKSALRLLSYHAPFFDLGDPRQWSVTPEAKRLQPTVDAFHRRWDSEELATCGEAG